MKSATTWQRVKALYIAANELPEADREAFVEKQAAGDARARTEALRLLRAGTVPVERV